MMISGATATMGVTCSSTANGKNAASTRRLCTNAKDTSTPVTVARTKASSVMRNVTSSAAPSTAQSARSVRAIRTGEGTR